MSNLNVFFYVFAGVDAPNHCFYNEFAASDATDTGVGNDCADSDAQNRCFYNGLAAGDMHYCVDACSELLFLQ